MVVKWREAKSELKHYKVFLWFQRRIGKPINLMKVKVSVTQSCVWLSETPWTVAHQVSLSMDFPDKNTGMGSHYLLQGIFLTQGSKPDLVHCRQLHYHLRHQGSSVYIRSFSISQPIVLFSFPYWCPYICSLCLCFYFYFVNKFIYNIFLYSTYMC